MTDRITKLQNISVDNQLLRTAYEDLILQETWNEHNQLCFLNTAGHIPDMHQGVGNHYAAGYPMSGIDENDFVQFNPKYIDTIFHHIYEAFPFPVTRMRLMRIRPKRCYSVHSDGANEIRYHIPIITNENAFFFYKEPMEMVHLECGSVYRVEVSDQHSAVNFNPTQERIHLVLNAKL
jgi:hypothetical protein